MSNERFWEERCKVLTSEVQALDKESMYWQNQLKEIEATISVGDMVLALVRIGQLVNSDRIPREKIKINKPEEGGYKWNQH